MTPGQAPAGRVLQPSPVSPSCVRPCLRPYRALRLRPSSSTPPLAGLHSGGGWPRTPACEKKHPILHSTTQTVHFLGHSHDRLILAVAGQLHSNPGGTHLSPSFTRPQRASAQVRCSVRPLSVPGSAFPPIGGKASPAVPGFLVCWWFSAPAARVFNPGLPWLYGTGSEAAQPRL